MLSPLSAPFLCWGSKKLRRSCIPYTAVKIFNANVMLPFFGNFFSGKLIINEICIFVGDHIKDEIKHKKYYTHLQHAVYHFLHASATSIGRAILPLNPTHAVHEYWTRTLSSSCVMCATFLIRRPKVPSQSQNFYITRVYPNISSSTTTICNLSPHLTALLLLSMNHSPFQLPHATSLHVAYAQRVTFPKLQEGAY